MFTAEAQKAAESGDFQRFTDEYMRATRAEPTIQTYKRVVAQYGLARTLAEVTN